MAIMKVYAGASSNNLTELPSPVSLTPKREQIWSEKTGRNSSGEMIGTSVASKMTFDIKWGILDYTDYSTITSNLTTGFFYFGVGTSTPSSPNEYYRGEITYEIIQVGGSQYYKDISVSVIQK